MSTKIEWTDETWNPVRGCSRCSPGCDNCYAKDIAYRFKGKGLAYEGLATLRKNKTDWTGVVREIPESLDKPLRWRRPRRVFVNSQSDLFHEGFDFEYIAAVFGIMAAAAQHTFQILTKRADRLPEFERWLKKQARECNAGRGMSEIARCLVEAQKRCDHKALRDTDRILLKASPARLLVHREWPLPNVWLGVSVESRKYLPRLTHLFATAAAARFVSLEPLLGDIGDLSPWLHESTCEVVTGQYATKVCTCSEPREEHLDWVIVGGESGQDAREYDVGWGASIIAQCKTAKVPVFHKQVGSRPVSTWNEAGIRDAYPIKHPKGGEPKEWPKYLRVRQFPVSP